MLESLDLETHLGKKEYENSIESLHRELGVLQRTLRSHAVPVLVVVEGWEASGKGYVINEMLRPLDPRGYVVHNEAEEDPEAARFPSFRRFWRMVPEAGKIVFLNRSWYRLLFRGETLDDSGKKAQFFDRAAGFEGNLLAGGVRILRLFLHVGEKEQKKRIAALLKNPSTRWRVSDSDLAENRNYEKNLEIWEEILNRSDHAASPWICIPANDLQVAARKALAILQSFFTQSLVADPKTAPLPSHHEVACSGILKRVGMDRSLTSEEYGKELPRLQGMLLEKQYDLFRKGKGLVVLFEGWDASGKGGAIKRLTQGLDPRGYVVHPISAPNELEKAHPYLWRFWTRLPGKGHIAIFDRSWYGRVLVERVEGYCSESDWRRAYSEINGMEQEWVESGFGLVKFWLHITPEEQLRRFREREETDYKKWKITPDDWRNRQKWPEYEAAAEEMLLRTNPPDAPWTIVEGNDKRFARVKVLRTVLSVMKSLL